MAKFDQSLNKEGKQRKKKRVLADLITVLQQYENNKRMFYGVSVLQSQPGFQPSCKEYLSSLSLRVFRLIPSNFEVTT
jgi:hypothetical protein